MKLKCLPEDFRVEELPVAQPDPRGRFVLYRLTKTGLGTLEALESIRRRWDLPAQRVSYGGLKDRHAQTVQYLTIWDGPDRTLRQSNLTLEPVGRLARPYGPRDFRGNAFAVVVRDLDTEDEARVQANLKSLPRDGLPNYFDDQRFGSVGYDGGFIGHAWLVGDHERALRLALAAPNRSDRPGIKAEKAILNETWGHWAEAKARLPRSHTRSLVTYLVDHPTDFRGAFARLRRDLRSIYFSAFQSHLWNRLLAAVLERETRPEQRFLRQFRVAQLPIHHDLDPDQADLLTALRIPLPASRNPVPNGPLGEAAHAVLTEYGLTWPDVRVKHLKDVFLSKGDRAALFLPNEFRQTGAGDELHKGRRKIVLEFELPKGAYATMLVKRLTETETEVEDTEDEPESDEPAGVNPHDPL